MPVTPSTEPPTRAISQVHITADRRVADLTLNAAAQFAGHAEIFTKARLCAVPKSLMVRSLARVSISRPRIVSWPVCKRIIRDPGGR